MPLSYPSGAGTIFADCLEARHIDAPPAAADRIGVRPLPDNLVSCPGHFVTARGIGGLKPAAD